MSAEMGDPARSRVFRRFVTMEVVWLVPEGVAPPLVDVEALMRGALHEADVGHDVWVAAGEASLSELEELTS